MFQTVIVMLTLYITHEFSVKSYDWMIAGGQPKSLHDAALLDEIGIALDGAPKTTATP